MTKRFPVLAWGLCIGALVFMGVGGALQGSLGRGPDGSWLEHAGLMVGFSSFPVVGALIASQRPANPLGWLFVAIGLAVGVLISATEYAYLGLVRDPGAWPGATVAAWLEQWLWYPALMAIPSFGLLLFPDGQVPTRRWKWLAWASALSIVGVSFASMFQTRLVGNIGGDPRRCPTCRGYAIENPVGFLPWADGEKAAEPIFVAFLGLTFMCLVSLVVRYRRARAEQRQQIKLLLVAAIMFVAAIILGDRLDLPEIIFPLVLWLIPGAIAVAILKYRLYDIDVIINRTLVYGVLTGVLLASYLLIVVTLSRVLDPVTRDSDVAVAASTLAVAALFRPLRSRIQGFIDRRFYRAKYDAVAALDRFGTRLRDEIDVELVRADVLEVVAVTMQPRHASLWLRHEEAQAR